MAGGPGAPGPPASSARSPPRPRARRVPGGAPAGGDRAGPPAPLPRSPGLSGSRRRPEAAPPPGPGAAAPSRSPGAAPLPSAPARRQTRAAGAPGVGSGRRARAGRPGRVSREGVPAPSRQPPPTPRFALPPAGPLRPAGPRPAPASRAALRARGAGRRGPRPPAQAGRGGSAARGGTGGELQPVCRFSRAAVRGRGEREKARETGEGGKGCGGVREGTKAPHLGSHVWPSPPRVPGWRAAAPWPSPHAWMTPRAESGRSPCGSHLAESPASWPQVLRGSERGVHPIKRMGKLGSLDLLRWAVIRVELLKERSTIQLNIDLVPSFKNIF